MSGSFVEGDQCMYHAELAALASPTVTPTPSQGKKRVKTEVGDSGSGGASSSASSTGQAIPYI